MKRQRIIEILCFLILIVLFFLIAVLAVIPDKHEFEETIYTVKGGDCLWDIASDYCPKGMDKHEYIYLVSERNGIKNSIIYPGQKLVVFIEG